MARWVPSVLCRRGSVGAMGLSYGLFICFLLWGGTELCCPHPIWFLHDETGSAESAVPPTPPSPPVLVECLDAQLVVTVSKNLFGTGKLVRPSDLTLGPEHCKPLASEDTAAVVRFEVGLHECGNRVQVTGDALVYSTFLLHRPRPVGNLYILRTDPAKVPIECHYPRQGNVSSQAVLPTWVPFRTTVLSEEKLDFSMRLMEKDWNAEKRNPTFRRGFFGKGVPFLRRIGQGGIAACLEEGNSVGAISDQCMLASQQTIYITCHLKVTPDEQAPDRLNKACSFNKTTNSWHPVEGTSDICECCNQGNCGAPDPPRRLPPVDQLSVSQWQKLVSRKRRQVTEEADLTVGPLIFLGKAGDHRREGWTSAAHSSVSLALGLVVVVVTLSLAAVVLGLARWQRTSSYPVLCPAYASQ
ncbi:zona pellucida sperm-binding protein 3 [Echinops telfairi]|uniref:Zona pellucida sperm-binding protein 3 n=1 Tax=Echinops telfairi TaxID=9371 RepID=A0ABM0IRH8_ECHTE|nr:zona pellucida sperm-binding protein 3 [Echinops telfairi]